MLPSHTTATESAAPAAGEPFKPFVPPEQSPPEFTLAPIIVGSLLGIVFGASSIYLVLKVGLTVSASIPVAVLSFGLFRAVSAIFRARKRTVLENNIVQTAGSAGESIAFGVGLVMPALLVLGFDIDAIRVMTVGVFGGLLGILMMIPLRRAFIVDKHVELKYPEGTACADVLKAGEQGGATAGTLLVGLIVGFAFQFLVLPLKLLKDTAGVALSGVVGGKAVGLKGATLASDMSAPLLGVGYIIGPRIGGVMVAGGILAYLVIGPIINTFGENQSTYIPPAKATMKTDEKTGEKTDHGLIRNMDEAEVRKNYILYIGAGAVAAGGIISMLKALPVIFSSLLGGLRDLFGGRKKAGDGAAVPRTERDLPIWVVVFGSLGMILAMMLAPQLGLGFNWGGVAGAVMILLFGFLFVTVSSRLTGEIGSSSNPISGMTVATLLLTCLILLALGQSGVITIGRDVKLLALTIAGVVCVASSNGGTTSQALKTGHLLGATPKWQQYAILIGSLTSALVVGLVLIVFNQVGTVYTRNDLPPVTVNPAMLQQSDRVWNGQYAAEDKGTYKVLMIGQGKTETIPDGLVVAGDPAALPPGRYLVREDGTIAYRCDPAVTGDLAKQDDGSKVQFKFEAPKTQLVVLIINGILDGELPWDLVLIGVLIAVMLELCGLPSLAFAVGVYLPLSASVPIFIGGAVRWVVDKLRRRPDEGDSSPGVLLSSGYIAGGSLAALLAAGIEFLPSVKDALNLAPKFFTDADGKPAEDPTSDLHVSVAFAVLAVVLGVVGVVSGRGKKA